MGHRSLRLSAALAVIAAAGMILAPHVVSYVSTSAVVNAPVISIKAPFDGVVVQPSADLSAPVQHGEQLLQLVADRVDRTLLGDLVARRAISSGELAGIETQRARLHALRDRLRDRKSRYVAEISEWLAARSDEADARAGAARIRLDQLTEEMQRHQRLAAKGSLSAVALTDAKADADTARLALASALAQHRSVRLAARAVHADVAIDGTADGLGQILQRLDELEIWLAETEQKRTALTAKVTALDSQIATLRHRSEAREVFAPTAQSFGVLWKTSPPQGTPVLVGDELMRVLDCGRRFIEVAIPERHFERIKPASPAVVRLKGGDVWLTGQVEAVRGAGGRYDRPALAADVPRMDDSQLSVLVRLPPVDVSRPDVARGFCDVGRTADVRFEKSRGDLTRSLTGLVGAARDRLFHRKEPAS